MTTVYDVPADQLIQRVAAQLKSDSKIKAPEWAPFVRTGVHTEKASENPDWFFVRSASVLRKVYLKGPIGVEHIAQEYGGYRDRGSKPNRAEAGSGSVARKAIQRLEEAGLLQSIKGRGRVVSSKGRALLDNSAHAVAKELEAKVPALAKY
jgi:small subunit ribosomal protein S19e